MNLLRRELAPLEQRIRKYVEEHPGITQEDIFHAFPANDIPILTYATRHLISDGWLDEDSRNSALTIRDEPENGEDLK